MNRHPYIAKYHHAPPTQHPPPLTQRRRHARFLNRSASHHATCPPATRIVYPHRASSPQLVSVRFPSSARPRSLHAQPIPPSPASQCTHLACDPRHVCTSTGVCVLLRVVHVAASGERRVGVSSLLQARQVVHMALLPCCVCGYGTLRCTAESNRVCGAMHTPVCCSTVVDAARNGGSGSPAHSSHVCGCDLQATLSTLSTRTATPAAAQQNTRPILSTGPRSSSGEL
jgi:hypothetical protein